MMRRTIFKTQHVAAREIEVLVQNLLVLEMLAPSQDLWVVSAWVSDIEVIDNRAGGSPPSNHSGPTAGSASQRSSRAWRSEERASSLPCAPMSTTWHSGAGSRLPLRNLRSTTASGSRWTTPMSSMRRGCSATTSS